MPTLHPAPACLRAFILPLFLLVGCQAAQVDNSLTSKLGGSDDEDTQLEFWHSLAEQPVTCNDDAFHGLLLFLDDADPGLDYDARVVALQDRFMLPRDFDEPAEQAVSRGTIAVALAPRPLNIRGGVVMTLTGPNPRYATKELVFEGIYPPSSPNQTFSGTEFLGIIGKAEDFQRVQRTGSSRPLDSLISESDDPAGGEMPSPTEPPPPTP